MLKSACTPGKALREGFCDKRCVETHLVGERDESGKREREKEVEEKRQSEPFFFEKVGARVRNEIFENLKV